jgi:hypothetical protein
MPAMAINLVARPATLGEAPDPSPTTDLAAVAGPATATPRATGLEPVGAGSILGLADLLGPVGLHPAVTGAKPPARTADLPFDVGTSDGFTRGGK